jgi:hypothetical protein
VSVPKTRWDVESAGIPVRTFLWGPPDGHDEFIRVENCAAHLEERRAVPSFDPDGDPGYERRGVCEFLQRSKQWRDPVEAEAIVAYVAAQKPGGPRPEADTTGVLKDLSRKLTLVVPQTDKPEYKRLGLEAALGSRWLAYYSPSKQQGCPCANAPKKGRQNPARRKGARQPPCSLKEWGKRAVSDVRKRKYLSLFAYFTIGRGFGR